MTIKYIYIFFLLLGQLFQIKRQVPCLRNNVITILSGNILGQSRFVVTELWSSIDTANSTCLNSEN